jgi:hypothetical protein
MTTERYARGLQMMDQVVGELGNKTREDLHNIAADFERLLVEFPPAALNGIHAAQEVFMKEVD